jgi:ABC-type transporter Mla subunit MlaD
MQLRRNEVMTGLLVLVTVAIVTFILIMLGAPGLFRPLVVYHVYFDNAEAIKIGGPVLLAGRQIGQVRSVDSPVSREESAHALEAAGNLGTVTVTSSTNAPTLPHFEVCIDVEVDRNALVYKNSNVRLMTLGLLGETAIDFSAGNDHSGKAESGQIFAGNRVPDFSESISRMLSIIEPVATTATATLKELQNTSANLSKITDESSQLNLAMIQFKLFGEHLNQITAPDSSLAQSLDHIRDISEQLSRNDNIQVTLSNFRASSEKLRSTLDSIQPELGETLRNARDFTDTLRSQPWRLIYPTTKKYPDEQPTSTPARKVTKPNRKAPSG